MKHGYIAEPATKPFDGLGRQADFRHQDQRFLALANHFFDGLQIDFRFAAAGYAMKQEDVKPAFAQAQRLVDRNPGVALIGVQLETRS